MQGYAKAALKEASVQQKGLVQAFFRQFGDDEFNLIRGDAPPAAAADTGMFVGKVPTNPLLAGVDNAALPAAMEQYLAEVEEGEREEEELISRDGVVAPSWYTKANPNPNPNPNPNQVVAPSWYTKAKNTLP